MIEIRKFIEPDIKMMVVTDEKYSDRKNMKCTHY